MKTLLSCFASIVTTMSVSLPAIGRADPIRQLIFEDCNGALDQIAVMPQSEQQRLVSYLRLLLELKSDRITVGSPLDQYTEMPLEGLRAPAYSQLLESEREEQAKGCALSVIEHLGLGAIAALPEVFELSREQGPRGARARIIVQRLAEGMNDVESLPGLSAALEEMVTLYERTPDPQALEILARAPARTTAILLDRFHGADTERRQRLGEAIVTLDPSGVITGDRLLTLLEGDDPQLVEDAAGLLSRMPGVYGETVPRMLELLTAAIPVHRIVLAASLTHILSQPESQSIPFESSAIDWGAALLQSPYDVERSLGVALLLITAPHSAKIEEDILNLLVDPNSKEAAQGLSILARYPQLRDRSFARVVELTEHTAVSQSALMVLAGLKQRRGQVLAAFLRRAKEAEGELMRLEPVAQAVLKMGLDRDSANFGPIFGTALVGFLRCDQEQFAHSSVLKYFQTQKPFAERVLFEHLKSGLVGERCAVLHVVASREEISEQGYALLAASVQESEPSVAWLALGVLVERKHWQESLKSAKQFLAVEVERAMVILKAADPAAVRDACRDITPVFDDALWSTLAHQCRQSLPSETGA